MIAIRSNWKDIQRGFEKTFIKIKGFGDKLFFVDHVTASVITGHDSESTGFELWLDDSYPFDIDYLLPHHAVFQYKNEAVQLRRVPSRQYHKGLHHENTVLRSITTGNRYDLSFAILEAYVGKQQYPLLKEAIGSDAQSIALSSRMSYSRLNKSIMMDMIPIAFIANDVIKVNRTIFYKEIFEYIQNNNQPFKVSV